MYYAKDGAIRKKSMYLYIAYIDMMSTSAPPQRAPQKHPRRYLKEQQVQPQPRRKRNEQQPEQDKKSVCPTSSAVVTPMSVTVCTPCSTRCQKDPFLHQPRGQCVKPQCVPEATLVSSMAELVHDVIPQSTNSQTIPERIEWVNVQKCVNVNDRKRVIDVVVVGLARGYQIWARMENGDCEEILSERQGPLRTGRLLPMDCEPSFGIHSDRFESSRPLFALVDESTRIPEKQYCTVSFLSLVSAQVVHKICFAEPVQALAASTKIFIVLFINRIVVCDMMTLREQRTICSTQIHEGYATPAAISDVFLAFANSELRQECQSCGGMGGEDMFQDPISYSVVSVAKNFTKTLTAFGSSVVSSFSAFQQPKDLLSSVAQPGIVTIVDVNRLPVDNVLDKNEFPDAVAAHFVAHTEPIGFMAFGNGGQLLLTSGQSATHFHMFLLYPHPGSPSLGAVRHLYRLYRGTTPAKILSCAFSVDNRWLAIATNHGTTHIFGICPYGGQVTMRTHSGEIVNKESRFHRSAGLPEVDCLSVRKTTETKNHHQFSGAQLCREHPCVSRSNVARSVSNPRIGPYPSPIGMEAHVRIKQRFYSADNLSAWASDMTPASLTSGRKHHNCTSKPSDQHRLAITFASNSISNSKNASLLVVNNDGVMTEYAFSVSACPYSGTSGLSCVMPQSRPNPDETLIQCNLTAVAQWTLQRNKLSADVRAPICEQNPLWMWFFPYTASKKEKIDDEMNAKWISQIEVLTYSEPHRRLWMGPQFSFRTYIQSEHTSADLITPGSGSNCSDNGITKSVPVTIEAAGSLGSFDVGEPTEIIGGSWSSDVDPKGIKRQKVLKKKIEDAMHDLVVDRKNIGLQESSDDASSENSQKSNDCLSRDNATFQFPNLEI